MVAECANLEGKEVTFKIYEKEPLLVEKNKELPVLQNNTEVTEVKATVTNGYAVAEIELQKVEQGKYADWDTKLDPDEEELKTSELYIKVGCEDADFTILDRCFLEGNSKEFKLMAAIHLYEVDVQKYSFTKKIEINKKFSKYRYVIIKSSNDKSYFDLTMNNYNLLDFPGSGCNWGRYGSRDKGGDNWVDEEAAAAFFGFLYSLPINGVQETLYYNDISANNKRNIGHKTHRTGKDVDIRYPGADNSAGGKDWSISKSHYGSENKFVEKLESILKIAVKWNFLKKHNYAYKKDIKYTKGTATSVHQDHFHIGYKR